MRRVRMWASQVGYLAQTAGVYKEFRLLYETRGGQCADSRLVEFNPLCPRVMQTVIFNVVA